METLSNLGLKKGKKMCVFNGKINGHISETVRNMAKVTIDH